MRCFAGSSHSVVSVASNFSHWPIDKPSKPRNNPRNISQTKRNDKFGIFCSVIYRPRAEGKCSWDEEKLPHAVLTLHLSHRSLRKNMNKSIICWHGFNSLQTSCFISKVLVNVPHFQNVKVENWLILFFNLRLTLCFYCARQPTRSTDRPALAEKQPVHLV